MYNSDIWFATMEYKWIKKKKKKKNEYDLWRGYFWGTLHLI